MQGVCPENVVRCLAQSSNSASGSTWEHRTASLAEAPPPTSDLEPRRGITTEQPKHMNQKTQTEPALGLLQLAAGAINKAMTRAAWAALLSLLFAAPAAARAGEVRLTMPVPGIVAAGLTNNTAPAEGTNSAVLKLQCHLDQIKARIEAAVAQAQAAVASKPSEHAATVTKLANQIREVGTKELGDESPIMKQTDSLIAKMKDSVSRARALSSESKAGSREIYAAVLLKLEPELSRLIDAKSSVARIRAELLNQADALTASSEAIGFAEDADQAIIASTAIRTVLSDVVAFTRQLETMINELADPPLATK